ncbi:MAG: hypothetical protein JXJ19_07460 [Elusimicrobia bacterium]|nr:hypothetical protein [Elusimicrobiota bacterium]
MVRDELIADMIVDAFSQAAETGKSGKDDFKRGFFTGRTLSGGKMASARALITEKYLLDEMRKGSMTVNIPPGALVTPLARILVEEGKVRINGQFN